MNEESHVTSCPQCGAAVPNDAPGGLCPKCLMVQAAESTGGDGLRPEDKSPPPLEAVRQAFPQLEVLELLGQGGMAAVFKARQPKLNRLVALKILPERLAADPAFAERFAREGQMLARLNHPNIVTVYDFGESGGFYYLLMEYVDGVNLRQALHAGGFAPRQTLAIVPKICEALQYAHEEGVLHRDIKPENILVDAKGRVKIADFGIAKFVDHTASDRQLTGAGASLGTPHYMAPEQIERPSDVDHRADIYSLGVVFYELLTGELPLGRFAPPSEKAAVDYRVDDVVLRSLEKQRELRQQSAREVKTQVETIANVPAPAVRMPSRTPRWTASLLGTLGLCLPAAVFTWFVLVGHRFFGMDIDAGEQMGTSLIGFPASAWTGALLVWLLGSFRRRDGGIRADAPQRWSVRAIVGVSLVAVSMLLMGGGLVVAALLRQELGHWHPSLAELIFTLAFLGGGVLASVLATLAGWLACREIERAPQVLRGWQGACVAARFWPGVVAGAFLLLAATSGRAGWIIGLAVVLIGLAAFVWKAAAGRSRSRKAAVNPWPRRIFWLIVALLVVPPLLVVIAVLVPRFVSRTAPSQSPGPHGYVKFDNVTSVEDLLMFDIFAIVGPPQSALRLCYLGRPQEPSRISSVPKPAGGGVVGPAAELQEGSGQRTWQLERRQTGPAVVSSHIVLVLPDANMARDAAKQVRALAAMGDQHLSPTMKLRLFMLHGQRDGSYAAWLEFPSSPQGTAVAVTRRLDPEAPPGQPRILGNAIVPFGCVAQFDLLLRAAESERPLRQLSFFAAHGDSERRQEPLSVPIAWWLSLNERTRGPVIGHLRVDRPQAKAIELSCEVPDTELVAWRISPGYTTDEALVASLQHLPPDRWLDPIGPVAPGERHTSRLFHGESKLPSTGAADSPSLTIVLRVSIDRLPADWSKSHSGIDVQSGTPWREYAGADTEAGPGDRASFAAPKAREETPSR